MRDLEEILANTRQEWRNFVLREPCREWQRAADGKDYGRVRYGDRNWIVPRLVYTLIVGSVPDELDIDHVCRNHRCCEVTHLDPVPRRINLLRGEGLTSKHAFATHCPAGHPYDEKHTHAHGPDGRWRRCRECNRIKQSECAERRKQGISLVSRPRVTHCKRGHLFDEQNTGVYPSSGQRYCIACNRLRGQARLDRENPDRKRRD